MKPTQITRPITQDGMVGYDEVGQFWVFQYDPPSSDRLVGRIRKDLRGETCILCGGTWATDAAALNNQLHLSQALTHVHYTCYERHLTLLDREMWVRILRDANFEGKIASFTPIPNQYGGAWNTPWYRVVLKGMQGVVLTVGGRKRVLSIEVERLTVDQTLAMREVFKGEDTTKEGHRDSFLIHAWGEAKALDYLTKINAIYEPIVPTRADSAAPAAV